MITAPGYEFTNAVFVQGISFLGRTGRDLVNLAEEQLKKKEKTLSKLSEIW